MRLYRSLLLIGTLFAMSALPGCRKSDSAWPRPDVDFVPVLVQGEKNWSLFGTDGEFKCQNFLPGEPSLTIEQIFSMDNPDGTYSLWTTSGPVPRIVKGCDKLYRVGYNNGGLIPVCRPNSRISVVDTAGNVKFILKPVNGQEIMETSIAFSDGRLMVVTKDGKYGFADTRGEMVILPQFYTAADFSEGYAMVEISNNGPSSKRLYKIIDTEGKTVFNIPRNIKLLTYRFRFGRLAVRKDVKYVGFLDTEGKFIPAVEEALGIGQYDESHYAYMVKGGNWGVVDNKGEKVLEPVYETIEFLPDDAFLVQEKGGHYKVLDRMGVEKIDFAKFSNVRYVDEFGFVCKGSDGITILNKNGVRQLNRNLSRIFLENSASRVMRTNYYESKNPYSQLFDAISPYGIGKFKLGFPFNVYMRMPARREFVFTNEWGVMGVFKDTDKIRFSFKMIGDKKLASFDPDKSIDTRYSFNPDAIIKIMQVDVDYSENSWQSAQVKFSREMVNKGFTLVKAVEKNGSYYKLYKSYDSELIVIDNPKTQRLRLLLMGEEESSHFRKQVFGN